MRLKLFSGFAVNGYFLYTDDMEIEELQQKIDALNKKKQGFDRNRSICAFVIAVIIYYMYQSHKSGDSTWWFWLIMCAIIVIAAAILVYDSFQIKSIKGELDPYLSEISQLNADLEDSASDDDDNDDDETDENSDDDDSSV